MSGPVNVLAVIRHHELALREKIGTPLNELAEVHAAVTTLLSQHDKLLEALQLAEEFMAGFEGDESQETLDEDLATVRAALAECQS